MITNKEWEKLKDYCDVRTERQFGDTSYSYVYFKQVLEEMKIIENELQLNSLKEAGYF